MYTQLMITYTISYSFFWLKDFKCAQAFSAQTWSHNLHSNQYKLNKIKKHGIHYEGHFNLPSPKIATPFWKLQNVELTTTFVCQ